MKKRFVLRGRLRLEISGHRPQAFLNLLAAEGIAFAAVSFAGKSCLRFTVPLAEGAAVRRLAAESLCTVHEVGRQGIFVLWRRLRRRAVLLAGAVLFAASLLLSNFTVLTVSVSGNVAVSGEAILAQLRDLGLHAGGFSLAMDEANLAQAVLLRFPDLSWCAINFHGTHAEVLVREALPKPDLLDERIHGDILADVSGIIESIETLSGQALVEKGSVVSIGDMLIAGRFPMQFPKYSELEGSEFHEVRADGSITMRTWRTVAVAMPLEYAHKIPTGVENRRFALLGPGFRMNFYQNSGIRYANCDKITETHQLPWLPFALVREQYRQYDTQLRPIAREQAQQILAQQAMTALEATLDGRGEILTVSQEVGEENGLLVVTITGECLENVGVFAPYE